MLLTCLSVKEYAIVMIKNMTAALAFALFTLISSCATVIRGTEEIFEVDSTPHGATVRLSNGITARTPASFKVKRHETLVVTVSKSGYKTRQVTLDPKIDSAGGSGMAGNVLYGGLVGAAFDVGSGAMYGHKPNPLHVVLEKE